MVERNSAFCSEKNEFNHEIRRACPKDFEAIKQIIDNLTLDPQRLQDQEYKNMLESNGFLIPRKFSKEKFQNQKFLIYQKDNHILGFLKIENQQELPFPFLANWNKPDLKEEYFSKPHFDIGIIATAPNTQKSGIATSLLNEAINIAQNQDISYLFSFIVISPLINYPSIQFHKKNGFEKIAILKKIPFLFSLKNYQSNLYAKKL